MDRQREFMNSFTAFSPNTRNAALASTRDSPTTRAFQTALADGLEPVKTREAAQAPEQAELLPLQRLFRAPPPARNGRGRAHQGNAIHKRIENIVDFVKSAGPMDPVEFKMHLDSVWGTVGQTKQKNEDALLCRAGRGYCGAGTEEETTTTWQAQTYTRIQLHTPAPTLLSVYAPPPTGPALNADPDLGLWSADVLIKTEQENKANTTAFSTSTISQTIALVRLQSVWRSKPQSWKTATIRNAYTKYSKAEPAFRGQTEEQVEKLLEEELHTTDFPKFRSRSAQEAHAREKLFQLCLKARHP
uniref:Uncharacterized protein n=1 Tax=Mycena chlorophos TaxID=658473 RepID=A0ABQ0LB33_MYCCL|nr:predicted protein [Mycena chlorophos]